MSFQDMDGNIKYEFHISGNAADSDIELNSSDFQIWNI